MFLCCAQQVNLATSMVAPLTSRVVDLLVGPRQDLGPVPALALCPEGLLVLETDLVGLPLVGLEDLPLELEDQGVHPGDLLGHMGHLDLATWVCTCPLKHIS